MGLSRHKGLEEGLNETKESYLHVYLRYGIILEVFIVAVLQNIVVVESHPLWTYHFRKEGELFIFESLIEFFFLCPIIVLSNINVMLRISSVHGDSPRHQNQYHICHLEL